MEDLRKEVLNLVGHTILTTYGPSLVVGIVEEEGKEYVHLKEFGEEDYLVALTQEEWDGLLEK